MWPVALVALFTAGPFGVVLFLAALATQAIKVAKVDAQYAKQGKTPPSYGLVEKWLEGRKASGRAPKSAKVAKPGMWSYAWQRWQAMWEDLAERHTEVRGQYKTAVAQAKARGEQPPKKPTFKETLTGWKWHLDQLTPPAPVASGQPGQATPAGPDGDPDGLDGAPKPSPRPSTAPTTKPDGTVAPGMGWPTTGVCTKCGTRGNLTAVGRCEPCVQAGEHGFCSRCNGLMYRDGDVFRHGPHQGCDAVAPATNKVPPPSLTRDSAPKPDALPAQPSGTTDQQGGDVKRLRMDNLTAGVPEVDPNPQYKGPGSKFYEANNAGGAMTQPATQQSGEVIGLTSAINYAAAVAAAHEAHSLGGGEQYRASLGQAKVGDETMQSAARAQELSEMAGAAWRAHEAKLREQLAAKEATTSETGTKEFLLAD